MLNPLNTSMISVAFSRLQEQFQVPYSSISWLIATYYVTSAIAQPVMGKLSDMIGRKRIFIWGLLLVILSSALAPFSTGIGWLMAFRVIQALGTSSLFPSGMGMIRSSITENQARALSVMSIFSSTSAALGPSLGGVLIHYGDWPSIFFVNFPVIAVVLVLAFKVLPKDAGHAVFKLKELDLWGIVLFAVTTISWLFYFLSPNLQFNPLLLALGAALTIFFYKFEAKRETPFIHVLFLKKNARVSLIYFQFILINIVFYSVMFSIPSYLQQVRLFDDRQVGIVMLGISGFGIFITPLVGRWIDKSGSRLPLITGSLLVISGSLLMLLIHERTSAVAIFVILSVFGLSSGFQNLGMQTSLYAYVSKAETGLASGLFMTSRFVGTILSSSLLGVMFGRQLSTGQLHLMSLVCAGIGGVTMLLSMNMRNQEKDIAS
jgi:MFS family permease